MNKQEIPQVARQFCLEGEAAACSPYGNGHINQTYMLVTTTGSVYILQRINQRVFREPEKVMENILAVTSFLRRSAGSSREVLTLVPTKQGGYWVVDETGEYWRLYEFITGSICLERAESPEDFAQSATGFGRFQLGLAEFPAHTLHETIPNFHHTPSRFGAFRRAVEADQMGRVKVARKEIEWYLSQEEYAFTLARRLEAGELPLRVTHNDTKLNNLLLDNRTRKALCVIDLDTVMPGLLVHDFGDAIRFGASTAAEDEVDLSRVELSMPLFEAYTNAYLEACGTMTAAEKENLCDGARMMTLECGVRFLTDYLEGDVYFHTQRTCQNLDRCRTQMKLVRDMDRLWDQMQEIVLR